MRNATLARFSSLFNKDAKALLTAERQWAREMFDHIQPGLFELGRKMKTTSILDLEEDIIGVVRQFHDWLSRSPRPLQKTGPDNAFFYFSDFECVGMKMEEDMEVSVFSQNQLSTLPPFLGVPLREANGIPDLDAWIGNIQAELTLFDLWLANPARALAKIAEEPGRFQQGKGQNPEFAGLSSGLVRATGNPMKLVAWTGVRDAFEDRFFFRDESKFSSTSTPDAARVALDALLKSPEGATPTIPTEADLVGTLLHVDVLQKPIRPRVRL
jgi:hypothetical protein